MPIVSVFCKKGGVGKTTFLGYLAHYYAQQGKTVLVISADDQNSIFRIFGVDHFVTDNNDDFFENMMIGEKEPKDIIFETRINMYLMKTLNTDRLSINLTLKRSEEKHLKELVLSFQDYFDYIFVDFPPSSSRLSEILLDISQNILLVVGLDALGIEGYRNTIQYFVDSDIDLAKISHIIPVGYHPIKITPKKCLEELKIMGKNLTPNAMITDPVPTKSIIQNLQAEGVSIFDDYEIKDRFHNKNRNEARKEMTKIYDQIKL